MNEQRKRQYILNKTAQDITASGEYDRFFIRLKRYETRWNRDACDWSSQQIVSFLKAENKKSFVTLQHFLSLLSMYTDWCMGQGLSIINQNCCHEITSNILLQCVNYTQQKQHLVKREELITQLSSLRNPRDKFFALCLFEFGGWQNHFEDIVNVSIKDFDLKENQLYLPKSNRTVVVTDYLYQLAIAADEETQYVNNGLKVFDLTPNDDKVMKYVMREQNTVTQDRLIFQLRRISKSIMSMMGMPYTTAKDVALAGMLHKVKEYADYYKISPKQVIFNKRLYAKLCNQYGINTYYSQWWLRYGMLFETDV